MTIEDLENAAYDHGLKQGVEQRKQESAKRALSLGLIEQIANITQLSREEIEKLQKSESKCDEKN